MVQDVFDGQYKDVLDTLYEKKVWSEIDEDLKADLQLQLENSLRACKLQV